MFDESMRDYASRTLKQENVEIFTGHHVERVEPVRPDVTVYATTNVPLLRVSCT
jgi:NADH dehydrogenase FAD-containing subunit